MKKYFGLLLLVSILSFSGLVTYAKEIQSDPKRLHFYVGTYTDKGSEGIYSYSLDPVTGILYNHGLAAMSDNPSFLSLSSDKKMLLAVREVKDPMGGENGYIELFSVDENRSLDPVNMVTSGGAHPCHVAIGRLNYVVASNYSGGSLSLMKISENKTLSEPLSIVQHTGKSANLQRQEKPHVHSALIDPSGTLVFAADLGIDKVMVYQIDTVQNKLVPAVMPEIKLPPGSGPRHMAIHPNEKWLLIVNELTCTVSVVDLKSKPQYKIVETISTLPVGYTSPNTCADIHLSPDGNFLYVSNRGLNSIATFSFDQRSGKLRLLNQTETKGETPRNFTLTTKGDYLLVANQNSDNIVCFKRDQTTGALSYCSQINAFKPVCLLFTE